jgi:Helitron helicase-like domain at N-terminus
MDLTRMTSSEMMMWGLANLWSKGKEGGYVIKHGRQPVSDFGTTLSANKQPMRTLSFDKPNFFEKAFPCLFPYGTGGIEADRETQVEFRQHVKWALAYHDRRFRRHETFPFVAFGILQRRQALATARVQINRSDFQRDATILMGLTPERLQQAAREEDANLPIVDPAVKKIRRHVHGAVSRVQGTDQARYQLRSQIWSTALYHGPPSVWMTINPSDLHDPILQVFAGEDIDLDHFIASAGPDRKRRAQNVANDPYAAARFFHFIIQATLDHLLQIKVHDNRINTGKGILGEVAAYFGAVESQG